MSDYTSKDAATGAVMAMDLARIGPQVTCPISRHAAIMAESLVYGRPYPMLTEDPEYCGETIALTVSLLWRSRAENLRLRSLMEQKERTAHESRMSESHETASENKDVANG